MSLGSTKKIVYEGIFTVDDQECYWLYSAENFLSYLAFSASVYKFLLLEFL